MLFDGDALVLRDVHAAAAGRLRSGGADPDGELRTRFAAAMARLDRCADGLGLDRSDGDALADSWLSAAAGADSASYAGLVDALFSITKAKPLWQRVLPDPALNWTREPADWRAQVELKIADHIAHLPPAAHPIAGFMHWLRRCG